MSDHGSRLCGWAKRLARISADAGDEMTDEDREWAKRTATRLPSLNDRQREILDLLLSKLREATRSD
jgi:hypothetical protein